MRTILSVLSVAALLLPGAGATVLYGGLGGHGTGSPVPSTNDGALVTINQSTGAISVIGTPSGVSRITGLAFDLTGDLFASTTGGAPFPPPPPQMPSDLIRVDPLTGALLSTVTVTSGGANVGVSDIAIQPGTGILYAVSSPNGAVPPGQLYTVDKTTGVATAIGPPLQFFGTIAFAPDGTLYESAADFAGMGPINPRLQVLNPATGALIGTAVNTATFFGALAVRPDGVLFGGDGDVAQLFTINPSTGAAMLVGTTGSNFVGGMAFQPVPEPAAILLVGLGLLGLALLRKRKTALRAASGNRE